MHSLKWLFPFLPLLCAAAPGEPAPSAAAPATAAKPYDLGPVDRSVDPCVDFYQFACGPWMATHPIPPDRSRYNRFDELTERNDVILRDILGKAARTASREQGADHQKIGDFYAACMDEAAIEAKGATPIAPEIRRIAALATKREIAGELARLHAIGVNAFFRMESDQDLKNAPLVIATVDQGGLGLPDRDDYTRADPAGKRLREQYRAHVTEMLRLLGEPPRRAAADARAVVKLETALARASLSRVERRSPGRLYHKTTVGRLAAESPRFAWQRYFQEIGAPPFRDLNVRVPAFTREVSAIIARTPLPALKAYLRWHLLHRAAPYLSSDFVREDFAFYGETLRGARELRPRWKRCVAFTDDNLGEALGREYVAQTFGAEGKARTLTMVQTLERALRRDIEGLDWMTDPTRQRALRKLDAITNKIGYPDVWRSYAGYVVLRGDLFGNEARGARFELRRQLAKIGKPADKREWEMTPPTVNAYYDPEQNSINFPAGILQPPFYDNRSDDALNLGGIGAVIGHELTHGFDDEGRQFDERGNLRDWWRPEDARAFDERAQCFVDEYARFVAVGDVHVNGRLTLGENIADNGGARLALAALGEMLRGQAAPRADGLTPEQRLFVSYAQIWCQNVTNETARLLAFTDPHAPNRYRVNGPLSNMPEFQEAFACKPGQPMVRQNVCRIW